MILLQMGNMERSSNRRVCIKHGAKPTVILYIKLGTEELRGSEQRRNDAVMTDASPIYAHRPSTEMNVSIAL